MHLNAACCCGQQASRCSLQQELGSAAAGRGTSNCGRSPRARGACGTASTTAFVQRQGRDREQDAEHPRAPAQGCCVEPAHTGGRGSAAASASSTPAARNRPLLTGLLTPAQIGGLLGFVFEWMSSLLLTLTQGEINRVGRAITATSQQRGRHHGAISPRRQGGQPRSAAGAAPPCDPSGDWPRERGPVGEGLRQIQPHSAHRSWPILP